VAVAESVTGGAVCDALVAVPGASRCLRGGVVAYATDVKVSLLGVPADLIAGLGAVQPAVAASMAVRVRELLGADLGVATTGVAGPEPQDGHPPGEVYVAVADGAEVRTERLAGLDPAGLTGEEIRAAVRVRAVALALDLLARCAAPSG
ncbi:MAG TPA: CinA family protein, partial [Actinotalea sp.]|nr:CinA family protein [Actinotalea sp.]